MKTKSDKNIHQNAPNCSILKNFLGGACPQTPLPKPGAKHPASGMYISPQYYPPHVWTWIYALAPEAWAIHFYGKFGNGPWAIYFYGKFEKWGPWAKHFYAKPGNGGPWSIYFYAKLGNGGPWATYLYAKLNGKWGPWAIHFYAKF